MSTDHLSLTLNALAHPIRRSILTSLKDGDLTVAEVAKPYELTGPAITKHLKVLERAGLIKRLRDAQTRPCRLQPAPLKDVQDLIESYRVSWGESFDKVDELLCDREGDHEN